MTMEAKGGTNSAGCNCNESAANRQAPDYANLIKTGFGCDGYYDYNIYQCRYCGFRWASYIQDDSRGNTVYEKWNEKDFPDNRKQCF